MTPAKDTATASAGKARDAALSAMKALHSYAFAANARLGSTSTSVQGRAVLPANMTYTLTTTSARTEIRRLGPLTYTRSGAGPWQKLRRPVPVNPPLHSLLAALTAARGITVDSGGLQLRATLDGNTATAAGLLTNASVIGPVSVRFRIDAHHHITTFTCTATLTANGHPIQLSEYTDYTDFNTAAPITAP